MLAKRSKKNKRFYLRKKATQLLSHLEQYLNNKTENTGDHIMEKPSRKRSLMITTQTELSEAPKKRNINNNVISPETLKRGNNIIKPCPNVRNRKKLSVSFF